MVNVPLALVQLAEQLEKQVQKTAIEEGGRVGPRRSQNDHHDVRNVERNGREPAQLEVPVEDFRSELEEGADE